MELVPALSTKTVDALATDLLHQGHPLAKIQLNLQLALTVKHEIQNEGGDEPLVLKLISGIQYFPDDLPGISKKNK
ncbi:MAG TPA: hypothetical protein VMV49_09400 [Candidatus Deferrimicrobium sp.]|nr:hypothetical protein [Candidatus Deferrimicrobium sp.]